MNQWISVDDERKPEIRTDYPNFSVKILLYVPRLALGLDSRPEDAIRMGVYLSRSKKFRPSGTSGFEDYVTYWQPIPDPPPAAEGE